MTVPRVLRRSLSVLLLAPGLVVPLGCDDDDGPRTVAFRVDLTVVEPDDRPVEGIEVRLHVPIPGFAPKTAGAARRARTVTGVQAPVQAHQIVEIYDLEGRRVRRLFDGVVAAGVHRYAFDGRNDAGGALLGTHVLDFRFTARDAENDTLLFEDRFWATLYTGVDREQTHFLGVTDARGRLTVTDPSLFPGLYQLSEMEMRDEQGDPFDSFQFGEVVEFVLQQEGVAGYAVNPREVAPGLNRLSLTWVSPLPAPEGGSDLRPPGPPAGPITAHVPIDPPIEWEFHRNYPNPFN